MAIQVGDNFDHKSKKPLDGRISYATLALMKAVADANIYEGCVCYCVENDKYYKFLSTNTVDQTTGKWREYSSGGGGGSTYTAGDGIVIDNDEISIDEMSQADMSEIVTPLPSVKSHGSWVELTGTLTAGETSITFTSDSILADSFLDVYTDADIDYNSRTATVGSLVLTYDAQQSDVIVKVRVS